MKKFLPILLFLSVAGSLFAGGVSGTIKYKDPSKKKDVTITAPAFSQSCRSVNGIYQLELPESAKGAHVKIKVENGVETTVKVPKNGYAKLNFVFD